MAKAKITLLVLLIFSNSCFGQNNLLIDSIDYPDSVKLIATSSKFNEYEFSIERMKDILTEIKKLKYQNEIESSEGRSPIVIKLVVKGKIINSWIVNPILSSIKIDHKYYLIDINQLSLLHQKYPISYTIEEKNFISKSEHDAYYSELLHDKTFLYIVSPDFERQWQGKFILKFKKTELFSSPVAIMNYAKPIMAKIIPEEKFSISYDPFYKEEDTNEFIISISSQDYKLYKEFEDKNAIKGKWFQTPYIAYIIRKK